MSFECFEISTNEASVLGGRVLDTGHAATVDALIPLVWAQLKRGSLVITASGADAERAWLTLGGVTRSAQPPVLHDRISRALDAVLRGRSQKVVSFDEGIALSTLALNLRNAIERMGLKMRFSRVPLAVPLLCQAVAHPKLVFARIHGDLPSAEQTCTVVLERTESAFEHVLSPRELEVALCLLDGQSYEQMSLERDVSVRTIANQICAIGRKLNVRGRFDLLRASIERRAPTVAPPASTDGMVNWTPIVRAHR